MPAPARNQVSKRPIPTRRDASQPEMSSLKPRAPTWYVPEGQEVESSQKSPAMFVTADTSHVEMCPYVAVAAAASSCHACTAVTRAAFRLNA